MRMSRRDFVQTGLGASAAFFAGATLAEKVRVPSALTTVHEYAAVEAAKLAAGRSLTLKLLIPDGSQANVKPVASWFESKTGIPVSLSVVPVDEINTHMMVDTLGGTAAFDVALPATFGLPDLIESQALLPLDGLAEKYAPATYLDDSLYSVGDFYRGQLYGYQTDGDAYVMFYNTACLEDVNERARFFDQHGFELDVPTTWEQLDAMMAFFHRPDQGKFGGALYRNPNYIAWEFWMRLHAKGVWPFDEEMNPQIDNDGGVEALNELVAASKHLHPSVNSDGLFANWSKFSEGQIFCNIGWGGTQKFLNNPASPVRNKLTFGTTPGGTVQGQHLPISYFNWGWNYTVSRASQMPEIAYLFILSACSPTLSTVSIRQTAGYFDPFRREHYTDRQIVDAYSTPFLRVHRASMESSIPDLYLKGQGEYFDALSENVFAANEGEMTSQQALSKTAQQWRRTTRRMGRAGAIEQWKFLRSRYPRPIGKLLR
ncbi:MAG: extracellular solute-binding protein [Gammaproteobacteria bacterium]|nr:extracellular solute-binding protein [Gammaproteobacteria bacterium]